MIPSRSQFYKNRKWGICTIIGLFFFSFFGQITPISANIPINVSGLPPGTNWSWGVNINDELIYEVQVVANHQTFGELKGNFSTAFRINQSDIVEQVNVGQNVANLSAIEQIGCLNPSEPQIIDRKDNRTYSVIANFTNNYMGLSDVSDNIILLYIPLNNTALNLTWVGEAMLQDIAGLENYYKIGMNDFAVMGNSIRWKNTTNDDYINCTFFDNGTLSHISFSIDYISLGLGEMSLSANMSRIWTKDWFFSLEDDCNISPNDKIYYQKTTSFGDSRYIEFNITAVETDYEEFFFTEQPAWVVSATARFWNKTVWQPLKNNDSYNAYDYGENIIGRFNKNAFAFNQSFGIAPIIYPKDTSGDDLLHEFGLIFKIWELADQSSGTSWANFSKPDNSIWVYIQVNSDGFLQTYEFGQQLGEFKYITRFEHATWPRAFYGTDFIPQIGETMIFNITQNTLTPSPIQTYNRFKITSFMNTEYLPMDNQFNPGTVVIADNFEANTYPGVFNFKNQMQLAMASDNKAVFFYNFPLMTTYIFPSGTTGADLYDFAWWYRIVINPNIIKIEQDSISLVNTESDQWFNITVTGDGILQEANVNCSYIPLSLYFNYTIKLLDYDAFPRCAIDISAAAFDNATNIDFSADVSVAGGDTINSYHWNFGDGTTSTNNAPTHRYANAGTYTVSLNVTDTSGDSINVTRQIVISAATASFMIGVNGTTLYTIQSVLFTITSEIVGNLQIQSYSWDFDDGVSSTSASPVHKYNTGGTYQVELNITMSNGDKYTITKTVEILTPSVVLDISHNVTLIYLKEEVRFEADVSIVGPYQILTYFWSFGDDTTSTEKTPVHQYEKAGKYTVSVLVTMTNDENFSISIEIEVKEHPIEEKPRTLPYNLVFVGIILSLAIGFGIGGIFTKKRVIAQFATQADAKKATSNQFGGSNRQQSFSDKSQSKSKISTNNGWDEGESEDIPPIKATAAAITLAKSASIISKTLPVVNCPHCGLPLPKATAKFCGKCGKAVAAATEENTQRILTPDTFNKMDRPMQEAYTTAQQFVQEGQVGLALQAYEHLLNLAKKIGDPEIVRFVEQKKAELI
jgi:PKD repeat protein